MLSRQRAGTRWRAALGRVVPSTAPAATPGVWVLALAAAALVLRAPLMLVRAEALPGGDSEGYLALAADLRHGEFLGMVRTPGYPAFLAALDVLPGRVEDAAVIVQHLLGVAIVVAVVLVARRYFGAAAAVIAGVLAAIGRGAVTIEDVILADFLFGAVAFAGAVALAAAAGRSRLAVKLLVVAGAAFALAAYVKPVGQVLVLAPALAFLLAGRHVATTAKATAVVAGTMVLVLSPWLARNLSTFDRLSLSNQEGVTLYNRAFEKQQLSVPTDDAGSRLVARLTDEARAKGRRENSYVSAELLRRGLTMDEVLELQRRAAVKAIRSAPAEYAKGTVRLLAVGIDDIGGQPNEVKPEARLAGVTALVRVPVTAVLHLGNALTQLWFVLAAHLAAGLLLLFVRDERRGAMAAFVSVLLVVLLATVMTHGGMWRYSAAMAPEAWVIGAAGLAFVGGAAIDRLRAMRRASASA